jgi:hypothetical protein
MDLFYSKKIFERNFNQVKNKYFEIFLNIAEHFFPTR